MFAFDKPLTWVIILVIVLLIFGAGKLPDIGKSLGKSIKEFKDETKIGLGEDKGKDVSVVSDAPVTSSVTTPVASATLSAEPVVRRRIIKHPDGREEIIEEQVAQK